MKPLRFCTFVAVLAFSLLTLAESSPKEIRMGFIPGDAPDRTQATATELSKVLGDNLGVKITPVIPKNYQELIGMMKDKKVDFAFFSAMTFVFAEKQAGAKVLLKKVWIEPFYYSVIVTRKNSRYRKIEDLKNKTIAFVDEKSASGYLYPEVMFKKKKINPAKFFKKILFKGNHQAAVQAVISGEADAAAVYSNDKAGKDTAWREYGADKGKNQRILWVSEAIPNDPFCVRKDFYEKYPRFTHDMMFALIDLGMTDAGGVSMLKKLLDVKELKLATTRQYDPVREMVKELNLKMEP
jgi:phosphonate transport system substrate-binding protein